MQNVVTEMAERKRLAPRLLTEPNQPWAQQTLEGAKMPSSDSQCMLRPYAIASCMSARRRWYTRIGKGLQSSGFSSSCPSWARSSSAVELCGCCACASWASCSERSLSISCSCSRIVLPPMFSWRWSSPSEKSGSLISTCSCRCSRPFVF